MKKLLLFAMVPVMAIAMYSCSKTNSTNVSKAQIQVGATISDTTTGGTLKGTMIAGKTYTITHDITVNAGDTLLIQKGVTLNMTNGANFFVNGTFVTLGTKDAPITITDPKRTKKPGYSTYGSDSAYAGGWGGIWCGPKCALCVIKWTHLDFGGASLQSIPFSGPTIGQAFVIWFGNPNGNFIMEDSWMYGSPDDAVRFYGGHINVMRNTLEKLGGNGGDGFNSKSGTQGNMAYNLFIGGATNGTKCSNDGGVSPQNQIAMYNNTYVNMGFRNAGTFGARGANCEVENNSRALVYNNMIVNCLVGYRIAGGTNTSAKVFQADTAMHTDGPITHTAYGYNFMYADSTALANQFVPTNIAQAVVTIPQSTDIPDMRTFLGTSYTLGASYNGASLVGKNDPQFVNYPLPNYNYKTQASVDGFDFHLKATSPAVGKGYTGFSALTTLSTGAIPVDPNFGSSEITAPGSDIGCYQISGKGNQH